jgi:ABC-type branched-subunit amino acid transport system substrate-binding protein
MSLPGSLRTGDLGWVRGWRLCLQGLPDYSVDFVYNIPKERTSTEVSSFLSTLDVRDRDRTRRYRQMITSRCTKFTTTDRIAGRSQVDLKTGRRRGLVVRNGLTFIASVVLVLGATLALDPAGAGASSPADQGVTSTTIRIGFPVINFPALAVVGVHLNDGNFQDAIKALTAYMNKHGGIDGRKIVPYIALDDPAITASSQSVCTQLTEDDHVFVAIAPVYPDCYQATHDTPVINGTLPGTLPANAAVDFTLTPPDEAYDPIQFAAFKKAGIFKGKKVGIYYGSGVDGSEARSVQSDLKKLGVDVVQFAGDDAPATDTAAVDQDTQTIALRFKSEGVNEVIAVGGSGATDWPRALDGIQSTYKPPWIATNYTSISSDVAAAKGGNPYFDNVMTSDPSPSIYQAWQDPAIQKCYKIVHKAYPSDPISPPPSPDIPAAAADSSNATYAAVLSVCATLGIFAAIADHAGKDLTVASFTKAGYGLRNVTLPGSSEPVSFEPNRPYLSGQPHLLVYSTKLGTLVPAPTTEG